MCSSTSAAPCVIDDEDNSGGDDDDDDDASGKEEDVKPADITIYALSCMQLTKYDSLAPVPINLSVWFETRYTRGWTPALSA